MHKQFFKGSKALFFIFCTLFFSLSIAFAQPYIRSFSPDNGPAGTVVTIKGTGFDIAGKNIVYFGAVKAGIINFTDTTIQVTVPVGATYQPVSVFANQLTGYADKPFIITFPGAKASFSAADFMEQTNIAASVWGWECKLADIDGDGKADIVTNNSGNRSLSVLVNKSTPQNIAFAPALSLGTYLCKTIAVGDITGDGLPDIVAWDDNYSKVHFHINKSTPGNISFVNNTDFTMPGYPNCMDIGDVDGDGKADIAFGSQLGEKAYIYRNTTVNGNLSFNTGQPVILTFGTNQFAQTILLADMNADGKKDLLFNYNLAYNVSVYKNNSTGPGNISFPSAVQLSTPYAPNGIAVGDLDKDGKPEIITPASYGNVVCIFKNISNPGDTIKLAARIDYPTGVVPRSVAVTDMDGDALPDVVVGNVTSSSISVYKNIFTDSIKLAPKVDYNIDAKPYGLALGDMDGDGKPDMAAVTDIKYRTSILRNSIGEPLIKSVCPPVSGFTLSANTTGTTYQWQVNTGNGFINIVNDAYYNGAASIDLQVTNAPSSWYGYQYRCLVNNSSDNSNTTELRFKATWLGTQSANWEAPLNWSCSSVPDINTDVLMDKTNPCQVNTQVSVRSLKLTSSQVLQVLTGADILVTH